jgi:transposase
LYVERRKSDPAESQVASRRHVGGPIGVGPETLRGWVERDERNAGARPGLSDEASAEVRQLRKENAELKRANDILRTASAYVPNDRLNETPMSRYVV